MTDMCREFSRAFPSSLDSVALLLDWLEDVHPADIAGPLWMQAQTAVVEGFTNAVRHAHASHQSPPEVGVRVLCRADGLELQVLDCGAPFQMQPEHPEPGRDRQWGLILLQELQLRYGWHIHYEPRDGEGNVLRIHHSLPAASP